jgi:hypothetical protein
VEQYLYSCSTSVETKVHLLPLCAFMECACVQLKHSEFRPKIPVNFSAPAHQLLVDVSLLVSLCWFVYLCGNVVLL